MDHEYKKYTYCGGVYRNKGTCIVKTDNFPKLISRYNNFAAESNLESISTKKVSTCIQTVDIRVIEFVKKIRKMTPVELFDEFSIRYKATKGSALDVICVGLTIKEIVDRFGDEPINEIADMLHVSTSTIHRYFSIINEPKFIDPRYVDVLPGRITALETLIDVPEGLMMDTIAFVDAEELSWTECLNMKQGVLLSKCFRPKEEAEPVKEEAEPAKEEVRTQENEFHHVYTFLDEGLFDRVNSISTKLSQETGENVSIPYIVYRAVKQFADRNAI